MVWADACVVLLLFAGAAWLKLRARRLERWPLVPATVVRTETIRDPFGRLVTFAVEQVKCGTAEARLEVWNRYDLVPGARVMLHCNPRITTRVALPERGNSEWLAAIPAGLALFYTLLLLLDV